MCVLVLLPDLNAGRSQRSRDDGFRVETMFADLARQAGRSVTRTPEVGRVAGTAARPA
jgi:hypothetical protein